MAGTASLEEQVKKLTAELEAEKKERSFYQIESNKIREFWEVTQNDLKEAKGQTLIRERQLEELEDKHQLEIKIYKQKVKHLLYEYQNNVVQVQTDAEKTLQKDRNETAQQLEEQIHNIRSLKVELKEQELAHEAMVKNLKLKHDQELSKLRAELDRKARDLNGKYERIIKQLREDLEIKRKSEVHEIEERKNSQINALMKNHDKAFAEIKNYYTDITLNNLALINSLKEQMEEMRKKEERNEKLMSDIAAEKRSLSEPYEKALSECEVLKKQLQHYEKDTQSLASAKLRYAQLEEKHKSLLWEHEVLLQSYSSLEKEQKTLFNTFTDRLTGVQQKNGLKAMLLEKKLESLKSNLEKKDIQLGEVLRHANLDPSSLASLSRKLEDMIESKNNALRGLQYDLAKVTKTYNDMVRAFQTKLAEHAIPIDDLGFQPLIFQPKSYEAAL